MTDVLPPAVDLVPITKADDGDHEYIGFYVGDTSSGDNLKLTMGNGQVRTLTGLTEGAAYSFSIKRVWATDSTAASIFGIVA